MDDIKQREEALRAAVSEEYREALVFEHQEMSGQDVTIVSLNFCFTMLDPRAARAVIMTMTHALSKAATDLAARQKAA